MTKRKLIPNPEMPGTLLVPLTQGYFAIIDEADGEEVGKWNWCVLLSVRRGDRYAQCGLGTLHRFLWKHWGAPAAEEIDHENGNGFDCRRSNLRAATRATNAKNRRLGRDNTSGLKGVQRSGAKWKAQIRGNGKVLHLGTFRTAADAAAAYDAAARKFHGDFASTNGDAR